MASLLPPTSHDNDGTVQLLTVFHDALQLSGVYRANPSLVTGQEDGVRECQQIVKNRQQAVMECMVLFNMDPRPLSSYLTTFEHALLRDALAAVKDLRTRLVVHLRASADAEAVPPATAVAVAGHDGGAHKPVAPMPWREAAERMDRLRALGEPYTSQEKLASQIGCAPSTVNRAIHETPSLRGWAKRPAAPRAQQGLEGKPLDGTAQRREPAPADAAAETEILKKLQDAEPEERAFLNCIRSASPKFQLWYLELPTKKEQRKYRDLFKKRVDLDASVKTWFFNLPLEEQIAHLDDSDQGQKTWPRP
jgi:hypothetical protein